MTDREDWWQPQNPQQGYGGQYPQERQWQPQQYDPTRHHQRIGGGPPQDAPWQQYPPQYPPQQPPYGYQQPQQAQSPPPGRPQRAPRRKSRRGLWGCGTLLALFLVVIIIVAAHGSGNDGGSPSASAGQPTQTSAAATQAAAPATHAAAAVGKTVATFTGSGIENTPKFTVSSTWKLDYSFNCQSFGQAGNFLIMEDGSYGAMEVNALATSKTGSGYAYDDAGTHYLEINSECDWTAKVVDEGS
jgi:hypothetical protein